MSAEESLSNYSYASAPNSTKTDGASSTQTKPAKRLPRIGEERSADRRIGVPASCASN